MAEKIKINYNDTFGTKHTRDYYRGASFHFAGEWASGTHYINDNYVTDFVVCGKALLACAKSHLSTIDNKPDNFIYNSKGDIIGVVSTFWNFVLSGSESTKPEIRINPTNYHWEIKDDVDAEWRDTGVKAKFELSDLTPEDISELQRTARQLVEDFLNNVIVQQTGQSEEKVMSQKVVTDLIADIGSNINDLEDRKENKSNKTTVITEESTDIQYPSAKAVYDTIEDVKSDIETIDEVTAAALNDLEERKYEKPNGGIPKIDLTSSVQASLDKADASASQSEMDSVTALIPNQASAQNQLADKEFVNSTVATETTTFRGTYNLVTDLYLTTSATELQIATALGTTISTADNNDYCFVQVPTTDESPSQISRVDRYKYNGTTWAYEWSLNNSSFTAAQWTAINSGITTGLVDKLSALPTNSELQTTLGGKVDKIAGKGLSTEDYTTVEKTKLGTIAENAQVNVLEGVQVNGSDLTITNKKVNIDISGKEDKSNKVTSISNQSTDIQYPSAKAVYDSVSVKYTKPFGGIPSTDMTEAVQLSLGKADTAVQDVSGKANKSEMGVSVNGDKTTITLKDGTSAEVINQHQSLTPITELIPEQASSENQLADKQFVNSSIETNTATFRGTYNLVSDLSLTTSATQQQIAAAIATKLAALSVTADNNDYVFVQIPTADATPTEIERVDRYKYNGSAWGFEFSLNNSGYTAAQWAAINSGITEALVAAFNAKYDKPSGGIPASDMTSGVQTSLGKADSAYQKPNDGIPKSDLTSGVQSSLDKADTALQEHQDISGKANKSEMSVTDGTGADADKTTIQLKTGTSATVLKSHQDISGKQDVIQDLDTIRSGAAAGASAYQKPSSGIPASDIASGVIPDVSSFITRSVNDLVNYYLKSETYTKVEVQALIAAIQQFHYEVYASTSEVTNPASNVLYLIGPTGSGADKYEEYVWPNSTLGFVKIGDTSIDLSSYVTTQALNTALAAYTPTANLAAVATSGSYNDLNDKPTIPTVPTISTDIEADKTSDTKTASPKAVYDAIKDGSVKEAVKLTTEAKTNQEFVYRAAQNTIGADALTLDSIKGNTVVWNQLANNSGETQYDVLLTNNNDGTFTLNGTVSPSAAELSSGFIFFNSFVAGHKYYVNGHIDATTNYCWSANYFGGYIPSSGKGIIAPEYNLYFGFYVTSNTVFDNQVFNMPILIDLTLMFGAGNEPSTVAEFDALFPNYDPSYNAGELLNNTAKALETVGFNIWDEEWEVGDLSITGEPVQSTTVYRSKNFIPVSPGIVYYYKSTGRIQVFYYDVNNNLVLIDGQYNYAWVDNETEITPSNAAYIKLCQDGTTYNHDICINISNPSKNGIYEPYWKRELPLNLASIRVKDPNNPGGVITIQQPMKSAGSARNEISGGKFYKRVGSVDLGELEWSYNSSLELFQTNAIGDLKVAAMPGLVNPKYVQDSGLAIYNGTAPDKSIGSDYNVSSGDGLLVKDSSYTDAATFTTAMSGVILNYELATEEVYELAEPPMLSMPAGTTERIVADGMTAPMVCDMTYGVNPAQLLDDMVSGLNSTKNEIDQAKEDKSNKVTSLSSSSTDDEYPSAKAVYDIVGDVETLLALI